MHWISPQSKWQRIIRHTRVYGLTIRHAAILACGGVGVMVVAGLAALISPNAPGWTVGALALAGGAAVSALAGMLGNVLVEWFFGLRRATDEPDASILLYGLAGSGKTTLSERILGGASSPLVPPSDERFWVMKSTVRNPLTKRNLLVHIAQYSGQNPDQIIVYPPEWFFGNPLRPKLDVLVLLVDLAEAWDAPNRLRSTAEVITRHATDGNTKLNRRIRLNERYLGSQYVQTVLRIAGRRLRAVRLVVTKLDILRAVVDRDFVTLDGVAPRDFAEKVYDEVLEEIAEVCRIHGVNDVEAHVVSLETGEGVEGLLLSIWRLFK